MEQTDMVSKPAYFHHLGSVQKLGRPISINSQYIYIYMAAANA